MKNASFEADRKAMPSPVKPVQTYLIGWETTVLKGNKVSLDTATSPVLNHANSEEERKIVIGERSLNISDKVPFERKVSQVISSSPYVKLPDGLYTLKAYLRNNDGFSKLEMYAESAGKGVAYKVKKETPEWTIVELKKIPVKNGKVEIGFSAEGNAGASCQVDDVSLVLEQ